MIIKSIDLLFTPRNESKGFDSNIYEDAAVEEAAAPRQDKIGIDKSNEREKIKGKTFVLTLRDVESSIYWLKWSFSRK